MSYEVFKTFTFEAAHRLPYVPEGHKCKRLHGHSFRADIHCSSPTQTGQGMVIDFAEIKKAFQPLLDILDHSYLNELGGVLYNPTSENIAWWVWQHLRPKMPAGLALKVVIHETCTSGASYNGQ